MPNNQNIEIQELKKNLELEKKDREHGEKLLIEEIRRLKEENRTLIDALQSVQLDRGRTKDQMAKLQFQVEDQGKTLINVIRARDKDAEQMAKLRFQAHLTTFLASAVVVPLIGWFVYSVLPPTQSSSQVPTQEEVLLSNVWNPRDVS